MPRRAPSAPPSAVADGPVACPAARSQGWTSGSIAPTSRRADSCRRRYPGPVTGRLFTHARRASASLVGSTSANSPSQARQRGAVHQLGGDQLAVGRAALVGRRRVAEHPGLEAEVRRHARGGRARSGRSSARPARPSRRPPSRSRASRSVPMNALLTSLVMTGSPSSGSASGLNSNAGVPRDEAALRARRSGGGRGSRARRARARRPAPRRCAARPPGCCGAPSAGRRTRAGRRSR